MHRTLTMALLLGACTQATTPPAPSDGFDRKALLTSVGDLVVGRIAVFEGRAQALQTATVALSAAATPANRDAARDAWKAAMLAWQVLEPMAFGPAGLATDYTSGQGLRDELYSWPTVNPCRVDQVLAAKGYEAPSFPTHELVTAYGLGALEYLLFREDAANACAPQATVNTDGTWAALTAEELAQRRADYAAKLAAHVVAQAGRLAAAWSGEGGYARTLATAGESGSAFKSQKAALDEVFAGMFYADQMIKDLKLADPAGLGEGCTKAACPERLESPWARTSRESLRENLRGLRMLLLGGDDGEAAVGFDDWLVAARAPELAASIEAAARAAEEAVEAIPAPMHAALETSPEKVRAAHAAVKALTDLLKSQFVTTLNLSVPQEGAADND
jgi:predicted lipoprotein